MPNQLYLERSGVSGVLVSGEDRNQNLTVVAFNGLFRFRPKVVTGSVFLCLAPGHREGVKTDGGHQPAYLKYKGTGAIRIILLYLGKTGDSPLVSQVLAKLIHIPYRLL